MYVSLCASWVSGHSYMLCHTSKYCRVLFYYVWDHVVTLCSQALIISGVGYQGLVISAIYHNVVFLCVLQICSPSPWRAHPFYRGKGDRTIAQLWCFAVFLLMIMHCGFIWQLPRFQTKLGKNWYRELKKFGEHFFFNIYGEERNWFCFE